MAWYKAQYLQLEHELEEFRSSSQELEKELEKDLEAAEKKERTLKQKAEALNYEVDEWKVCVHTASAMRSCLHNRDSMTDWRSHYRESTRNRKAKRMRRRIPWRRR